MLVGRLGARGIAVTGVTKAVLGDGLVAGALLRAGVSALGDSRIENLERLRRAGSRTTLVLLRGPMRSQVDRVVATADISCNTELAVIEALDAAARARHTVHRIVVMVELGDLREGVLAAGLEPLVRSILRLSAVELVGIGTNLACRSGVVPDATNMAELSALVAATERITGRRLAVVSGGNSANLDWALGTGDVGRIDDLRLGESILLGREPLRREPITGLDTGACTIVAEVIESKRKPTLAWGQLAQSAFGAAGAAVDRGVGVQTIVALGRQDVDPDGLTAPEGVEIVAASSDHLVLVGEGPLPIGTELRFQPDYSALLRAATSPFVEHAQVAGPLPS